MKTSVQNIQEKILKDWSSKPRVARSCRNIFEHFLVTSHSDSKHLTSGSIRKLMDSETSDLEFIETIRYLSGSISVLSIGFEYINDFDESYEISSEELEILERDGLFIDPDTGNPVDNPEDNIFIFFSQSDVIRSLKEDTSE